MCAVFGTPHNKIININIHSCRARVPNMMRDFGLASFVEKIAERPWMSQTLATHVELKDFHLSVAHIFFKSLCYTNTKIKGSLKVVTK